VRCEAQHRIGDEAKVIEQVVHESSGGHPSPGRASPLGHMQALGRPSYGKHVRPIGRGI
jgi:hypothetical protein